VLQVRVDREAVYWGQEQLWELHPDIVRLLVMKRPVMLAQLLDDHMWTSMHVVDCQRCAVFYIKAIPCSSFQLVESHRYGGTAEPQTRCYQYIIPQELWGKPSFS